MLELVESILDVKNSTIPIKGNESLQIILIVVGMSFVLVTVFGVIGVVSMFVMWKTRNTEEIGEDDFYDMFKKVKIDVAENYEELKKEKDEKELKEFMKNNKSKKEVFNKYIVENENSTEGILNKSENNEDIESTYVIKEDNDKKE